MPSSPRILCNMVVRQSPEWLAATDTVYDLDRAAEADASPAAEAWRLFRRGGGYDVVVTMGSRTSLLYGLLCRIARRPARQILTEVFIDPEPPRPGPVWRVKNRLFRAVVRRSLGVLTNSSEEVRTMAVRYGLPEDRFVYVPMHTNLTDLGRSDADDGFVLCAGRTLRDFDTLARAAPAIRAPVVAVCGHGDLRGPNRPANLEVRREILRHAYLDLLRRCTAVALPLRPVPRSTGQVVMLEAMALGKPVVTNPAPGTLDHIRDGETGLLVPPGDPAALADAVNRLLDDRGLRDRLADRALAEVAENYTYAAHIRAKLEAIRKLWGRGGSRGQSPPLNPRVQPDEG